MPSTLGRPAAWILLLLFGGLLRAQGSSGEIRVIDRMKEHGEVEYEIRPADAPCRIRWVVSRSGINAGIAQLRSDCSMPLQHQWPLQSRILTRLVADDPGLRTLFWGRLGRYSEWSDRLAHAALRSPEWDAAARRPKSGKSLNTFVADLLVTDDAAILRELRDLFTSLRLRMRVSGVEKVEVRSPDRTPHDCLIWIAVERIPKPGGSSK